MYTFLATTASKSTASTTIAKTATTQGEDPQFSQSLICFDVLYQP